MIRSSLPGAATRARMALAVLVAAAAVLGCGGGSVAGPGVGGTGAFASGPISGFGSVIVNGVHFDDSSADIVDDDGQARSRADLALGMTVEVQGSPVGDDAGVRRSTASVIRYGAELLGPVDSVDAAAGTLQVFGIGVKVKSTTVFSGAAGLAGIPAGAVVEVHGLRDDSGAVVATRIELEAASLAAYAADPAHRLRISSRVVAVAGNGFTVEAGAGTLAVVPAAALPAGVVAGATVRLRLLPLPTAGAYTADRIVVKPAQRLPQDVGEAEIEGFVDAFDSATSFRVAGVPVTTSATTRFENGSVADLALGARVEVEGAVSGGVLAATKVEFKVGDDNDPTNDGNGEAEPFELQGSVSTFDAAARTFVVRGQAVRWDDATRFEEGSAADLADGVGVELRAVLDSDGTRLLATLIKIAH